MSSADRAEEARQPRHGLPGAGPAPVDVPGNGAARIDARYTTSFRDGEPTSARVDPVDALTTGLRDIVHFTRAAALHGLSPLVACRTHAVALQCAAELERLGAAIACDRTDRRRLERELDEARSALEVAQRDFEDSHAGELHARHLALHDDLTHLPNRRHCKERLNEALASAAARHATAALMFIDLDAFKSINDQHGHETGDEVLRIVAARLSRAVRTGDIVGRLGGDEFVCLPQSPMERPQLAQLARKLFDAISTPLSLNNHQVDVRPSIGVAVYPTDAASTDGLLKAADAAMYRAKQDRTGFAFARAAAGGQAA